MIKAFGSPAVFWIFGISVLILLMFLPFSAAFRLLFCYEGRAFCLRVGLRIGFLRLRFCFRPVFSAKRGLILASEKNGVLRLPKKKTARQKRRQKKLFRSVLPAVSLRRLRLSGEIGIPDDAAVSCFLAGALRTYILGLMRAAAIVFLGGRAEFSPAGFVRPVFSESRFSLELSGIVRAVPAKLIKNISAALIAERKERKKEKKYAPDRKHHADLHGADQAHGGC